MASLRIPFPEKDEPVTIALTGARITIGRLPFNTVQIVDRTMSGFHAELIMEAGHYRLHDRGSTNGTFVNGEPATDYHLRETCKISFGTVQCEFNPAAEVTQGESVPTRGEMNAVRQENAELRSSLATLREEVAALHATKPADGAAPDVDREEFSRVVAERQALKEAEVRHEQEVARLKTEVAVLRRDRENLQKAWDATKAELARAQRPVEAVPVVEVAALTSEVEAPVVESAAPTAVPPPVPAPAAVAAPPPASAHAPTSPPPPPPPRPLSREATPVSGPRVALTPAPGSQLPSAKPSPGPVRVAPQPMPRVPVRPGGSGVAPAPLRPGAPGPAKTPLPSHDQPKQTPGPKGTQRLG